MVLVSCVDLGQKYLLNGETLTHTDLEATLCLQEPELLFPLKNLWPRSKHGPCRPVPMPADISAQRRKKPEQESHNLISWEI